MVSGAEGRGGGFPAFCEHCRDLREGSDNADSELLVRRGAAVLEHRTCARIYSHQSEGRMREDDLRD